MDTLRFLDILGFTVGLIYLYLEYKASIWLWLASLVMPAIDMVLYYKAGLYADFGLAIYYCLIAIYGFAVWMMPALKHLKRRKTDDGGTTVVAADSINASAEGTVVVAANVAETSAEGTVVMAADSINASAEGTVVMAADSINASAEGPSSHGSGARDLPITHFRRSYIVPATAVFIALWVAIWWFLSRHTNSTVPISDAFTTALSIVAMWALARKYVEQWLMWLAVDAVCTVLYVQKGIPFKAAIYAIYTIVAILGYRKWLTMMHHVKSSA